jgi:hypothetical protein
VGVAIDVAGTEDETSAELKWIFAQPVLAVAAGARTVSCHRILAAKEMQQRSRSKACCAIRLPLLVDEERERDASLLAEQAGVAPVAEPDRGEARAPVTKRVFVLAQLRDMLAAKHSAVVAEENDDCRAAGPERAELNRVAVTVGQDDSRELLAE